MRLDTVDPRPARSCTRLMGWRAPRSPTHPQLGARAVRGPPRTPNQNLATPDSGLEQRGASRGPSWHAMGGAAGERRGAAEEQAAHRRAIRRQAWQRPEDRLVERVGASTDVAVHE